MGDPQASSQKDEVVIQQWQIHTVSNVQLIFVITDTFVQLISVAYCDIGDHMYRIYTVFKTTVIYIFRLTPVRPLYAI